MKTERLTKMAIVTALYIVLTIPLGTVGYGPIQFRIAEVLNLLAFIDPLYIPAVTLGCAISNFYSFGIIDVFVGSAATALATYLMSKTKNIWIASLWPAVFSVFVAAELYYLNIAPFWASFIGIAISEIVIVTVIGVPVFKIILKNKSLVEIIKGKK
ncbi:MAG: QueT transporter family protein [Clostridiaceae bacterium]